MRTKWSSEERYKNQLAASRAWKERNKEKVRQYAILWDAANRQLRKDLKKKWDSENIEHKKEYAKKFKVKYPDYYKRKHLSYCYGMPIEEYDRMLHNQNNRCAVCRKLAEDTHRKRLFVDHNHTTGKIRALLCQQCNTALGMVNEDSDILFALVAYLDEHR